MMPVKRGAWCWATAVIVGMFLVPSTAHAKPPGDAGRRAKAQGRGDQQKDQKRDPSENIAPQDAEYQKGDASHYVGSDTCRSCHEDVGANFDQGPHWKTTPARHQGPQWQGCEACHGSGKEHAESADPSKIIRFPILSREEASKRCLGCHEVEHANFLRSQHLRNNVGCVDCHSIHHPLVERKLLKASQPSLCYSCHAGVKPDFSKPFHHGVNEGLVLCTNCHNPHDPLPSAAAQAIFCFNCHAGKAGPFAFEHTPVKTKGCAVCHTPHGSENPQLLRRSQVNLLCLQCHTFTADSAAPANSSFHHQAQMNRACTLCHVAVHGSKTNRFLLRP